MEAIILANHIKELVKSLQGEKKKIVLVGGCFDLLHAGHIALLEEAKQQGDVLVVLLESDARIRKLKGSERPLHTQQQRAHMLTALRAVDYVVLLPDIMHDNDYDKLVNEIQPAIIATTKGSDSLVYIQKQAERTGAKIFLVEKIPNLSTSRILDAITKEL